MGKEMEIKREPDFETDRIRAWKVDDKKEAKKIAKEEGIEIKLGDNKDEKIMLCGFSGAYDKVDKHLVFAWKVNFQKKSVLYYIADETQTNKVMTALNEIRDAADKQLVLNILKAAAKETGIPAEVMKSMYETDDNAPKLKVFSLDDVRSSFLDVKKMMMAEEAKDKAKKKGD